MIVEFAGLPGSGKSTLHRELGAALTAEAIPWGLPSALPSSRLRQVRTAIRCGRVLISAALLLARSERTVRERLAALRWVAATLDRQRSARAQPSTVWIFDEGIAQRVFLLFVDRTGAADHERASRFLRMVTPPDVVAVVRVPPAVALERLERRSPGLTARFQRLDQDARVERLEEGAVLLDDGLADAWDASVSIVRLDGADDPSAGIGAVVDVVRERR